MSSNHVEEARRLARHAGGGSMGYVLDNLKRAVGHLADEADHRRGIPVTFTFYREGGEHSWYGETLPAPPRVGDSVHPGDSLGEEFERCWAVFGVRWVHTPDCGWALEVELR